MLIDLRLKRIYVNKKKPKKLFKGKYIVSSNHISYIDPVIMMNAFFSRRLTFVCTAELFKNKFFGALLKGFRCIGIDKDHVSFKTFKLVKNRLIDGHPVAVFPEGHLNEEKNIGTFKSGISMMAAMSDADIIPMYIGKRKNRWHRQRVVIGEKIHVKDYIKGPMPTMVEINTITEVLEARENVLQRVFLERVKEKKRK